MTVNRNAGQINGYQGLRRGGARSSVWLFVGNIRDPWSDGKTAGRGMRIRGWGSRWQRVHVSWSQRYCYMGRHRWWRIELLFRWLWDHDVGHKRTGKRKSEGAIQWMKSLEVESHRKQKVSWGVLAVSDAIAETIGWERLGASCIGSCWPFSL